MTSIAFAELAKRVDRIDRRALDRAGLRAYLADLKQIGAWKTRPKRTRSR